MVVMNGPKYPQPSVSGIAHPVNMLAGKLKNLTFYRTEA
jgi:hypothetical protein